MKRKRQQQLRQRRLANGQGDIEQLCQNCYHQRNHPSTCLAKNGYPVPVARKSTCEHWRFS